MSHRPGRNLHQPPTLTRRPAPLPVRIAFVAGGIFLSAATLGAVLFEASGGSKPSRATITSSALPLSPSHFTPVEVTQSTPTGTTGTHKLISLKVPPRLKTVPPPPVFSVYLKDSDIQVERPYTPLKGLESDGTMTFWVRRYDHGEVGRWFHRRKVGETVEIRGPVTTLEWQDGRWDEVILVSGGTGITPFYQLLHSIFASRPRQPSSSSASQSLKRNSKQPKQHITLMHASSSMEALPPPVILDDLNAWSTDYPSEFTFKPFVDAKADAPHATSPSRTHITEGRIDGRSLEEIRRERGLVSRPSWLSWFKKGRSTESCAKSVLFVVCGPESMMTTITGSRIGRPKVAGKIEGILGGMGYNADNVRRL